MAVTSSFNPTEGVLSTFGDALSNNITFSRNAAGNILVNGGAVSVLGGTPTVANTALIQAFGQGGDDVITLNEASGALPDTNLFGGNGNDTLTSGSGTDLLFGQEGNDVLLGKGGIDQLFGGAGNDTLTGGDADDLVFGGAGNDRMIWNPGDDSDVFEGGADIDTAEVNAGNGVEVFTITANGDRVSVDRVTPAPFNIDIGTTENLVINANGGDDTISAVGNLAGLIQLTLSGGDGNDTILGGNGNDVLRGDDGNDFIDGNQGNDTALLGDGGDVFQWDQGDGSDVVEGQAGNDTLIFNGNNGDEAFDISANGERTRLFRNAGNITMDLNDVETIALNTLDGKDTIAVNDLTGTHTTLVAIDLAGAPGSTTGDGSLDSVTVNGTGAADAVTVSSAGGKITVAGLAATVTVDHADATDALVIKGLGGKDTIDAAALAGGTIRMTIDGGAGNDRILGSAGVDTLIGGDGDDFVDGNQGNDVALLGTGNDTFQWDQGDGSDVVEGQSGTDTLVFNSTDNDEVFDIAANGERARVTRNLGNIVMDLNEVEQIDLRTFGGSDSIHVGNLKGTDVSKVAIDLAGAIGGTTGDGKIDSVTIDGTSGRDAITLASVGSQIVVKGLAAQVTVDHADQTDVLAVNGFDGNDTINASAVVAGAASLQLFGGGGADTITGSAGDDLVNGGTGNDVAKLGAGNDTFVWNPGDGSDVVDGQAGNDTLLFNGNDLGEIVDIAAHGSRVDFDRDLAGIKMDLNGIETINFNALGGADNIHVGDLSGTDAKLVAIDLAGALGSGNGDGLVDSVSIDGTKGDDVISLSSLGSRIAVDGLPAQVTIDHADAGDKLAIHVGAGDDVIDAGAMPAGKASLQLFGDAGDDIIIGSAGDDTISGGAGDDVLFGNAGNDVFQYASKLDGRDIIADFDGDAAGGQDVLNLDALFDSLKVADADRAGRVSITGGGGVVDVGVDTDGNAANGFELTITLNTAHAVTIGEDIIVSA